MMSVSYMEFDHVRVGELWNKISIISVDQPASLEARRSPRHTMPDENSLERAKVASHSILIPTSTSVPLLAKVLFPCQISTGRSISPTE